MSENGREEGELLVVPHWLSGGPLPQGVMLVAVLTCIFLQYVLLQHSYLGCFPYPVVLQASPNQHKVKYLVIINGGSELGYEEGESAFNVCKHIFFGTPLTHMVA